METTFVQGWALFVDAPDSYELIYIRENGSKVAILSEQVNSGSHYGAHARLSIGIYNACYSWDHFNSEDWDKEITQLVKHYDAHHGVDSPLIEIQLRKNGEFNKRLIL